MLTWSHSDNRIKFVLILREGKCESCISKSYTIGLFFSWFLLIISSHVQCWKLSYAFFPRDDICRIWKLVNLINPVCSSPLHLATQAIWNMLLWQPSRFPLVRLHAVMSFLTTVLTQRDVISLLQKGHMQPLPCLIIGLSRKSARPFDIF